MEIKEIMVRLNGELRVYFEQQKKRLGEAKDVKVIRTIIREHKRISEIKY